MRSTKSTSAAAVANQAVAARVVARALGESASASALGVLGGGVSARSLAASVPASEAFLDPCWGETEDVMPRPYPVLADLHSLPLLSAELPRRRWVPNRLDKGHLAKVGAV